MMEMRPTSSVQEAYSRARMHARGRERSSEMGEVKSRRFCEEAGIAVEWEIGERAWRAAGAAFQVYAARRRRQKGAEARRILADFVIGAHALVNGYKLLTLDARMYEAPFPRLAIRSL